MELNKCPNCSGKLEMAPSRKKMICPYCGSEFSLDESTDTAEDAVLINKDWFNYEWDYESLINNPRQKRCLITTLKTKRIQFQN